MLLDGMIVSGVHCNPSMSTSAVINNDGLLCMSYLILTRKKPIPSVHFANLYQNARIPSAVE